MKNRFLATGFAAFAMACSAPTQTGDLRINTKPDGGTATDATSDATSDVGRAEATAAPDPSESGSVAPPQTDASAPTFALSGTVSGLTGSGLVLRNNGGNGLAVGAGAATFTFDVALASGAPYEVSVAQQPHDPSQTCVVAHGGGIVGSADAPEIVVDCSADTFKIAGSVSGLVGTGLVLRNGTDADPGAGDAVTLDGRATAFSFPQPVPSGARYAISIARQPSEPAQTCTVIEGMGMGTVAAADVSDVAITCLTESFSVGGTIAGLAGGGLVLTNNGGDNIAVPPGATSFTFPRKVTSGGAYAIAVLARPDAPTQSCSIANASGRVGDGQVSNVAVTCTTQSATVGGSLTGLVGGGLVLRLNDTDSLVVPAGAKTFTFAKPVLSQGDFSVTVFAQPTEPAQTCVVSGGHGTVGATNVTSVVVNCSAGSFTVGGQVNGLKGTLLIRNGSQTQTLTSNGGFAFATPVASGSAYAVDVAAQPVSPSQTCVITSGAGIVGDTNVGDLAIACTTDVFRVRATVVGLVGGGLVVTNNASDPIAIAMDGSFTFPTAVPSGGTYNVAVSTQPAGPSQTCSVVGGSTTDPGGSDGAGSGGAGGSDGSSGPGSGSGASVATASGRIGGGDVTVTLACRLDSYRVRIVVTGLVGGGLVIQNNRADDLSIATNGAFTFATPVPSGGPYAITISSQPSMPTQTCTVTPDGDGTVAAGDVTANVVCVRARFRIGGSVTGLLGSGLVLQDRGGDDLAIAPGATTFGFETPVSSGGGYDVSVKTPQPTAPGQTCVVTNGAGSVTDGDVTSVLVECTTNPHRVTVDVTNLRGQDLVLQNNGGDDLAVDADGAFTFETSLSTGDAYLVTVANQPSFPSQTCTVAAPEGSVADTDIVLSVDCVTPGFNVGGILAGPSGNGLVLRDNLGDDLAVPAGATTFTLPTQFASGDVYLVTVAASPPGLSCLVGNDVGLVLDSDIQDITVTCFEVACATAANGDMLKLSCPPGQLIFDVGFASYGTPAGICGAYSAGACDAESSLAVVWEACFGYESCTMDVTPATFGGDPCPGTPKSLTVQVICAEF